MVGNRISLMLQLPQVLFVVVVFAVSVPSVLEGGAVILGVILLTLLPWMVVGLFIEVCQKLIMVGFES